MIHPGNHFLNEKGEIEFLPFLPFNLFINLLIKIGGQFFHIF